MDVLCVMSAVEEHFLSPKWAEPVVTILAARHHASLPDKWKWAKRWDVDNWQTASSDSSGYPPVTQVATALIMRKFKT